MKVRIAYFVAFASFLNGTSGVSATEIDCVTHTSGKYAACLQAEGGVYVGVLKRLMDNKILAKVGSSPLIECLEPRFSKTKFGEELALFKCSYVDQPTDLDFGINLCGRVRNAGYLEQQNGHIPFTLSPSTRFKLEYSVSGADKNIFSVVFGGARYQMFFDKEVISATYLEYVPLEDGRLATGYYQVKFEDNSVRYFYGDREQYYSPDGHMSANADSLCLRPE